MSTAAKRRGILNSNCETREQSFSISNSAQFSSTYCTTKTRAPFGGGGIMRNSISSDPSFLRLFRPLTYTSTAPPSLA